MSHFFKKYYSFEKVKNYLIFFIFSSDIKNELEYYFLIFLI